MNEQSTNRHVPWHELPIDVRKGMIPELAFGEFVEDMFCPYCGEQVLHSFIAVSVPRDLRAYTKAGIAAAKGLWECLLCWKFNDGPIPLEYLDSRELIDARTGETIVEARYE